MKKLTALIGGGFWYLRLVSPVLAAGSEGKSFLGSIPILPILFLIILLGVGLVVYFFYFLPKKKVSEPKILPPEEEKPVEEAKSKVPEPNLGTTVTPGYQASMPVSPAGGPGEPVSSSGQAGEQPQTPTSPISPAPPTPPPQQPPPAEPSQSPLPEKEPEKPKERKKFLSNQLLLIGAFVFLLISIPLAVVIVKQRTSLKGKAVGEQCTENSECGDTNLFYCGNGTCQAKIDSAADGVGGCCDPGATGDRGCPSGENCNIPNGACISGKSCNPEGTGYHKECRGTQCVEVPGESEDRCTRHEQCQGQQATPTPGGDLGPNPSCSNWGYVHDDTCTANPKCETDPKQEGSCCKTQDEITRFFCCYRDRVCLEGLTPGDRFCRMNHNGSVTIGCTKAGQVKVITHDCTSNPVCACSENGEERMMDVTSGENTFSLRQFNILCGQIEVDHSDFCGSCGDCKDWDCNGGGTTPTPTGPTTPTPTGQVPVCINLFAFVEEDGVKRKLTAAELSSLAAGTKIYLGTLKVEGSEAAKFQIWKGGAKLREMSNIITYERIGGLTYYLVSYTVSETGSYSAYSWVKVGDIYR